MSGLLEQNTIDQVAYKQKNLFLTVLESGSLRSGCQPGWMGVLFQAADFSLLPHVVEGLSWLSEVSFIRALISFMKAPLS